MGGGQGTTCRNWFSSSTVCVLRIELRFGSKDLCLLCHPTSPSQLENSVPCMLPPAIFSQPVCSLHQFLLTHRTVQSTLTGHRAIFLMGSDGILGWDKLFGFLPQWGRQDSAFLILSMSWEPKYLVVFPGFPLRAAFLGDQGSTPVYVSTFALLFFSYFLINYMVVFVNIILFFCRLISHGILPNLLQ